MWDWLAGVGESFVPDSDARDSAGRHLPCSPRVVARVVTLPSGSDPGNPLTSVVSGLLNGDVSWCSILQGVNLAVAPLQNHWCDDAVYNAATLGHSYTLCGLAGGRI